MMRILVALVPAAAVAVGNYAVLGLLMTDPLTQPPFVAWMVGAPLLLGLALAVTLPRFGRGMTVEPTVAAPPEDAALLLLGALQDAGRLVDFLQEDLTGLPDEQVGAVARDIHGGCRKALGERVVLEPVMAEAEGATVRVEPGFDAVSVRLTGQVSGEPPFEGVLRHPGWRVTRATIAPRPGQDPRIITPAEVEIP